MTKGSKMLRHNERKKRGEKRKNRQMDLVKEREREKEPETITNK